MARSKVAENTLWLLVSGAGGVLFTLVQVAILSRFLPGDFFGLFVTLRGFSLLIATIMLAGLPQVLIRYLPTYQARGDARRAILVFASASAVVVAIGAGLAATTDIWARWMPANVRSIVPSASVLFWMTLSAVTLALKMLLYGGFNGLRDMRMQMILELVSLAIVTTYMAAARRALEVADLFIVLFLANALVVAAGAPLFVRETRRLFGAAGERCGEGGVVPNFFSYWFGSLLLSVVALAFTDVDRFVMSSVLPMAAISLFHVASRVDVLLKRFLGVPMLAAQPEITRIYEEGRWNDLVGKIGLFTKGTVAASLLGVSLVAMVGRDAVTVLAGEGYADAYPILLILLPTVPIAAIAAPLVATMRSLHFMRWAVLCDFLWMAVYFGSFFLFVSAIGVSGMAVAQIAASLAQMLAAVLLARREGFYGGVGRRLGRLFASLAVVTPIGMLATARLGIGASIACAGAFPFLVKYLIRALGVFDRGEAGQILGLVHAAPVRRAVAWLLSAEAS